MKKAPIPSDDKERLLRLKAYEILDTADEPQFDQITQAVAKLCGVKVALVSLVDEQRQWFKSKYGIAASETPRDISFCGHAIMGNDIFIVEDAKADERFCDNPLVVNEPNIAFYAGVPLVTPDNYKIGTLCIIHTESKTLTLSEKEVLRAFAQNIVQIFELNLKNKALKSLATQYRDVQSMVEAGAWELDVLTGETVWSEQIYEIYGIEHGTPIRKVDGLSFYSHADRQRLAELIDECILSAKPFDGVFEFYDSRRVKKWVRSVGRPLRDHTGKVGKIIGTFQDVTTQVEKEKNLSLVLNNITEGYFDWDLETDHEYISPQFWRLLGYEPTTKKHHPSELREILHPDDTARVISAHEAHFRSHGKLPYDIELRMRRSNGEYVWMHANGKVIDWAETGKPKRMVGAAREIQKERELIEKIKESSKYLDLAIEGANIGIWDWYLTDNRVKYSERWAQLRGTKLEELNMDLSDWESRVHPEDIKSAYESINNYLAGKSDYFESLHRIKHKDGRWIFILGRGRFSAWDETGKPTRFTGTDMDLTELMESKQELDQFFSLPLNYFCLLSLDGVFRKINRTWINLGYSETEILSHPFIDFVHPEDRARTVSELQHILDGKQIVKFENRFLKKDGDFISFEWAATVNPNTGTIFASATDVTERRKREDMALLLSEVRSRFIEYANDKEKFFSYILEKVITLTKSEYGFVGEILGKGEERYLKTYAITDISWNAEVKKFFKENAPNGLEFRNLETLFGEVIKTGQLLIANDAPRHPKASGIPAGHPPLLTFMGIPLVYNGLPFAMIGVANNTTGYRQDSYEYLLPFFELVSEMFQTIKLSGELENQRQLSLHHAKLASIGELAAGVGHEINNPLAIILGQIEMLKMNMEAKGLLDRSFDSYFLKMIKGVGRISNIVNGLRTFARMDRNQLEHFNLSELIEETIDMLTDIYRNDGITITCEIEKNLCIYGNPGRLQQVLVNLLGNARDAMVSSAEKLLSLRAKARGQEVIVQISDTGPGVDPSLREKIFDPFFTTKDVNKGTGIGLSLALSIVRDHRGELVLEKEAKSGASFLIRLPAQKTVNQKITTQKNETETAVVRAKRTVLIVDDEPDILDTLVYYLEKLDLKVLATTDALEAINLFESSKEDINLVISDMRMPKLSGAKFAAKLRDEFNYRGGFFLVTGGVNVSLEDYPNHITGIISKPFSSKQIEELVRVWVQSKKK